MGLRRGGWAAPKKAFIEILFGITTSAMASAATPGEFVTTLVALGRALQSQQGQDPGKRRRFIARLLELARGIEPRAPANASSDALRAFRALIMPNVATLMEKVAKEQDRRRNSLSSENKVALEALEGDADFLGLLGQARDEVSHTRMLATFLDNGPRARLPALAPECARRFELLLQRKNQKHELELQSASARAEHVVGRHGRVDVMLQSDAATVFIEAKIDAAERDGQLEDYGAALEAMPPRPHQVLVFLTAREDQRSTTLREHIHITFENLLLAWLPLGSTALPGGGVLRSYLKTVAVHLCKVAAPGPFEKWPLHVKRKCLDMLQKED